MDGILRSLLIQVPWVPVEHYSGLVDYPANGRP